MTVPELKPLVFLSHSAGGDQPASDLLKELSAGLKARGWDVYYDEERLQPGTLWRHQLHTALAACDAAAILFSRKAYDDSEWVLKEATIFRWRHSLDPEFRLVPVLFPDVTRLELSEGKRYRPLAIGEFVPVQLPHADVVKAVDEALGPKRVGLSPIELLQQSLGKRFEGVSTNLLKIASAKLGKPLDWGKQLAPHHQFAIHLFHADMALVRAALSVVAPEMESADDVYEVIRLLEPFTVDPLAVAPVPQIATHDAAAAGARPAIAVNSRHESTGTRYIQRARCNADPWSIVTLANAGGADDGGSLSAELFKAIRDQYGVEGDDDEIRDMLDVAQQEGTPFFVLVHGPIAATTIDALRRKFASCVFFVLTGDTPDEAGMEANGIRLLTPKLDAAQEKHVRAQIELTKVIAANKKKLSRGTGR